MTARDMVAESHPEKRVCVIDSKSTAGAMGLLVRRARALILGSETPEFESVCDRLREYQAALRTVFTLECYDNLIKNGRMRPPGGATLLHTLGIPDHRGRHAPGAPSTWRGRPRASRRPTGALWS
jgi:fatty acid-binding protein DegV